MRNNLEYIQVIDKYLRGILSKEDNLIFENRLKIDKTLQTEVEKQKLLMEAIKRNALKMSTKKGMKSYKFKKTLKAIGTVVVIATVATVATFSYLALNKEKENTEQTKTELSQDPINTLPTTGFQLNTQKDTVIETENGLVLEIPSDDCESKDDEKDIPLLITVNDSFAINRKSKENKTSKRNN